jgi:hypothetical protein
VNTYAWIASDGKHHQQRREGAPSPVDAKEWICFDPEAHTYTDELGRYYQSGTAFVASLDDKQFNAEKVAVECAGQLEGRYAHMTPDEIMAQWRSTADVGTEAHEAVELHIRGRWRNDDSDPLQPIVDQFARWLAHARPGCKTKPERIIWDRDMLVAGTADVVSYSAHERALIIDDIKTWRELTPDRKKHASEQITLYAYMLAKLTGLRVEVGGVIMFENYFDLRGASVLTFVELKERLAQIQPAIWARQFRSRCIKEADMALTISGGVKQTPKRVVIYGTAGVGKTTFASRFPSPVFIDVEHSTDDMDVQRFDAPKNWNTIKQLVADIRDEPKVPFKTLVVDSIDWVEEACAVAVAKSKNKKRLSDIGYGKGELGVAEEIKALLDTLLDIQEKHGVNVVLTAHTAVKKFDKPGVVDGQFDRYEMKLRKHTSPLVYEWCNLLLFANFESETIEDGNGKLKGVGDGTKRVMHTERTDAYDAKNRYGLDNPLPFKYASIQHVIEGETKTAKETK